MPQSERQKRWYLKSKTAILEKRKLYYANNREACDNRNALWIAKNKTKSAVIKKKWWDSNKRCQIAKKYARVAVQHAVRVGKLERPSKCASCGCDCKTEAHHHNGYSRANRLDVIWLCKKCHAVQNV